MAPGEQYLPPVESTFGVVLRGYDRSQVAEHLRLVDAELRMIAADRNAAVDQASQLAYQLDAARTESERLRGQLTRMAAPPDTVEGMSERLQWMLRLAQEEVRDMRDRAESDAEATRASARAEYAELEEHRRRQTAQLDAEYARLQVEVEKHRSEVMLELDQLRADADERRSALDVEAETKRAQAENDFTITLAARRSEAEAQFADLEAQRRAEAARILGQAEAAAERTIAQASEKARRLIAAARDDVLELQTLRQRIVGQLGEAQHALDHALPLLNERPEDLLAAGDGVTDGPPLDERDGDGQVGDRSGGQPGGADGRIAPSGSHARMNA